MEKKKVDHGDIMQLRLHETTNIFESENEKLEALRVVGGWVYTRFLGSNLSIMTSVFVPFTDQHS